MNRQVEYQSSTRSISTVGIYDKEFYLGIKVRLRDIPTRSCARGRGSGVFLPHQTSTISSRGADLVDWAGILDGIRHRPLQTCLDGIEPWSVDSFLGAMTGTGALASLGFASAFPLCTRGHELRMDRGSLVASTARMTTTTRWGELLGIGIVPFGGRRWLVVQPRRDTALVLRGAGIGGPARLAATAMYIGKGQIVEARQIGVPVHTRTVRWGEPELMPVAVRPGV